MPNAHRKPQPSTSAPDLPANLSDLPALIDAKGVRKHLAPVGRTLLYNLASSGEIETASLGLGRGKRVFVTASVVRWIQQRMEQTKRPRMALRQAVGDGKARGDKGQIL